MGWSGVGAVTILVTKCYTTASIDTPTETVKFTSSVSLLPTVNSLLRGGKGRFWTNRTGVGALPERLTLIAP